MTSNDNRDLREWTADWQAAGPSADSAEQIRHYVKRRGGSIRSWAVSEFVIGGVGLPILAYMGWAARTEVERLAMLGLAWITIAAVGFGWWNWRGVLRSSTTSVAEYVAISAERHRRMRLAWRIGWLVLLAQFALYTIWIWDQLYSGVRPYSADAERFAWGWLAIMMFAAVAGLAYFGRWINRDAARFEALRRELEGDQVAQSTSTGDSARRRSAGARATRKPRRPPLT